MQAESAPEILVLGGGGILGEAWMSAVLSGIERAGGFAAAESENFVGTSAGSIVAAMLAAGVDPADRLGELPEPPPARDETHGEGAEGDTLTTLAQGVAGPVAALMLNTVAPGGRFVRRAALARVPAGRRSLRGLGRTLDAAGVRFDGRLLVAAVDVASGERVMFGAPGSPEAAVGEAVEASCAIPGVFRPVAIAGREYVDGGVWSPTNMDAVEAGRGDRVVCLNPTGSMRPSGSNRLGWMGPLSRTAAAVEAAALRRRGCEVTVIAPDTNSADAMGTNLMSSGSRNAVIDAGFAQGAALAGASSRPPLSRRRP
jgi:NTE family protein